AALDWTFSNGDPSLAIDLAAGSIPIFRELSLLSECHKWSAAALRLVDDTLRGSLQEMALQEALAVSSTWTRGNREDVRAAIVRALEIAQSRSDTAARLRLLAVLHMFLLRAADIGASLSVAEEIANTARAAGDARCVVIADWLLGCSYHFLGNQCSA